MAKSREKSEQGGSCGGRETGSSQLWERFWWKTCYSKQKKSVDRLKASVVFYKYWLLFQVGEEIRPVCSARH